MQINRDYYLKQMIDNQNNGLIKIITGIRRCGKSYLLDPLFKNYLLGNGVAENHIIKIDLDSRKNKKLLDPDILEKYITDLIVDNEKFYILLDEIQKVPDFESVLNELLRIENVDIYVTGSNSKFLSTDIITEFRGRGTEIRVYPLCFKEFMSVYNGNKLEGWQEYYTYGGLPFVVKSKNKEDKIKYLKELSNNVYINDVVERNNVKNDEELQKLIEVISSSIGSLTNPNKLLNTFKSNLNKNIDRKTISSYLKYLEEAFILEKAIRYDIKGKRYIDTPYKYYFTDIGIRNTIINYRQIEETHLMENILYCELKRRGYAVDVGIIETRDIINNKRDYKQIEVDFIANKGSDKVYIQSALNMPTREKHEQEIRPFLKINDSFKKIIIVKDYIANYQDDNGILIMNVIDFLLNENSL